MVGGPRGLYDGDSGLLEFIMSGWDKARWVGLYWVGLGACWLVVVWTSIVRTWEASPALENRSQRGTTPLFIAVSSGNRVLVQLLLEAGAGIQS